MHRLASPRSRPDADTVRDVAVLHAHRRRSRGHHAGRGLDQASLAADVARVPPVSDLDAGG